MENLKNKVSFTAVIERYIKSSVFDSSDVYCVKL